MLDEVEPEKEFDDEEDVGEIDNAEIQKTDLETEEEFDKADKKSDPKPIHREPIFIKKDRIAK